MRPIFIAILALALLACLGLRIDAQDKKADDPKAWAKTGEPGPEHELFKPFVGNWTLSVDGVKQQGSAEIRSIFGGRFLTEDVKLPLGPFSLEWHGIYGYDRVKRQFTAMWVDNKDTTTESGVGEADRTGRVLTFRGEHHDPRDGGMSKFVWRIATDGQQSMTIEMFAVDKAGQEKLVMKVRGQKAK